ncbi:ankyrin repeat domain-containing protein [Streptomyces decoyicus]|uniref:ankyrin repeat domain-containing protein n=1 Tax=Streptomyces decoyicus TaxID=249567 RepID=UPI002E321E9F|nr:ankyrin repeat domain-containing protein [Streptomyces decoyicus]
MAKALTGALISAIHADRVRRVGALLKLGASPSAPDAEGETPLYLAAVSGQTDMVRLLLEAGATPDVESRGEGTAGLPLCAAACWDHSGAVRELLAHGADPDRREDDGTSYTALMWAATGGHQRTAELLLEARADPDAGCGERTPLMAAAERGSIAVVRALLRHGADPHRTDEQGRTASDMALERCGKDVESELRERAGVVPDARYEVRRSPRAEGTELVELTVSSPDGTGGASWLGETGHALIAAVLRETMQG